MGMTRSYAMMIAILSISSIAGLGNITRLWAEESSKVVKGVSSENVSEATKLDDSLRDLLKPYADAFGFNLTTPCLCVATVTDTREDSCPFDKGKTLRKVEFLDKSFFLLSEDNRVLVFERGSITDGVKALPPESQREEYFKKNAEDLARTFVTEAIRESRSGRHNAKALKYACAAKNQVYEYKANKVLHSQALGAIPTDTPYYTAAYDWDIGRLVYYYNAFLVTPDECELKTTKEDAVNKAKTRWPGDNVPDKVEIEGPLISFHWDDAKKHNEPTLVWMVVLGTVQAPSTMAIWLRCENLEIDQVIDANVDFVMF